MKVDKQFILDSRSVTFTKQNRKVTIGLDNIAELTKDKHHEVKLVVEAKYSTKMFECKLNVVESEFKAYSISITCNDDKFLGEVMFNCVLETYDATLQELKDRKEKARHDLETLRDMGAIAKPDGNSLADEVNDLFSQITFKKRKQ